MTISEMGARQRFMLERILPWVPPVLIVAVFLYALFLPSGRTAAHVSGATLGGLLIFAMLTGVMSMAIVETVKRLTYVRGLYQRYAILSWLRRPGIENAGRDLLRVLQPAGLRLFNLPIEQLSAQISAAADLAMETSASNRDLLAALSGMSIDDIPTNPDDDPRPLELGLRVRIGLNQLQIAAEQGWAWQLRMAGCWLSGLLGLFVAIFGYVPPGLGREYVLSALLVGGFFAWLARDLTVLIERARR